jgi:hypothetical protein
MDKDGPSSFPKEAMQISRIYSVTRSLLDAISNISLAIESKDVAPKENLTTGTEKIEQMAEASEPDLVETEIISEKKIVAPLNKGEYKLEFIPLNSMFSNIMLTVSFDDATYRGEISVCSHYVDMNDIIDILNGAVTIGSNVTSAMKMDFISQGMVLVITITIEFRLTVNLKPIPETFIFRLNYIERNLLFESVVSLKRKLNRMEGDCKKIREFCDFFDTAKKPLAYRFYFSIFFTEIEKHNYFFVEIDRASAFYEYIHLHARFEPMKKYFKDGQTYFALDADKNMAPNEPGSCTTSTRKRKLERIRTHLSVCTQEPPLVARNAQLIISWTHNADGTQNFFLTHKCPDEIAKYIGDLHPDTVLVNTLLLALFEINLEFELQDKVLLRPSIFGARFECMHKPGVLNVFNILELAQNLPTIKDQYHYNPSIGFYKSL